MNLGQKVLQTYEWLTDEKREPYANLAIATSAAAAKAWWVHYVGHEHAKVLESPPELVAIGSAFVYPYLALSVFKSVAKNALSDLRAQTEVVGLALAYTGLEYLAYKATGMRNAGAAILPSVPGIPLTMLLAYCIRREASMPKQLLNFGKGVGKIVYNSGRKIGSLLSNESVPELPMHEFYQEEMEE